MKVFFALLVCLLTGESTLADSVSYVLCRNSEKIVRTIRFVPATGNSECLTIYTKAGVDRVVGHGRQNATCENIFHRLKESLETKGESL